MKRKEDTVPGVPMGPPVEEYCSKPIFDADGCQVSSSIGKDGKEYGDPVPLEPPVGYQPPPDIMVMVQQMIANERFRAKLAEEAYETFEEADDFLIDDDPLEPLTEYERVFYPPAEPSRVDNGGKRAPQEAATEATPPSAAAPTNADKAKEGGVASPPPGTPPPPKSSTST
jgi:hypothetical protein